MALIRGATVSIGQHLGRGRLQGSWEAPMLLAAAFWLAEADAIEAAVSITGLLVIVWLVIRPR